MNNLTLAALACLVGFAPASAADPFNSGQLADAARSATSQELPASFGKKLQDLSRKVDASHLDSAAKASFRSDIKTLMEDLRPKTVLTPQTLSEGEARIHQLSLTVNKAISAVRPADSSPAGQAEFLRMVRAQTHNARSKAATATGMTRAVSEKAIDSALTALNCSTVPDAYSITCGRTLSQADMTALSNKYASLSAQIDVMNAHPPKSSGILP